MKDRGQSQKEKSDRRNYISRNTSTKASSSIAAANLVIKTGFATRNLKKLKKGYQEKVDLSDTRGFLSDLRNSLGIPDTKGASKYGVVTGKGFEASISLTNHNANAQTYIDSNANYPYNLRLMIRKRFRKNTFKTNPNVRLEEYVYFGKEMAKCTIGNPYLLIIDGIISFLKDGVYHDRTGIAHINISP